ncbi:PF07600 family protein [Leptospira santarosai]|uniref:PF07600 family protein n=1 Tax=Leptospira santarosai TaxID=28183 RepID=A0A2P1QYQ9_9LEPT|nr:PF07600 family protein [Leptospira santarosai]
MEMLSIRSDLRIDSPLVERKQDVVTILIPESYFHSLNLKNRKALKRRLPILLKTYGKYLVGARRLNTKAGKTLYQKNPGKLKKLNFRIESGAWNLLGMYAQAHGVSRCFLFNYMLWLDSCGVGDSIAETMNGGVPTFHENYRMIWQLNLQNQTISRILEFEPDPFPHIFYGYYWKKQT